MKKINDFLDLPSVEIWNERKKWFEMIISDKTSNGGFSLSEQACALTMDLENSFCAGSWVSVLVLSVAIIDAHLREVEIPDYEGNTKGLIEETNMVQELDWLRKKRNKLIHVDVNKPAITVDIQWSCRSSLEKDARRAVESVFDVMFLTPCI